MNPTMIPEPAPTNPAPGMPPVVPPLANAATPVTGPVVPVPSAQSTAPVSPAQPVTPVLPVNPAANQATPSTPAVNPVIMPNAPQTNVPGQEFVMPQAQAGPAMRPTMVGATDPITMPAPPKAPDPVEEELKAPFRAAEPVPGSIGSAISVPGESQPSADLTAETFTNSAKNTPSVAFVDPAETAQMNSVTTAPTKPVKKKTSKGTLIALVIVALMVVIALAAVLVLQLNGMI